jgi:hypothetical protein
MRSIYSKLRADEVPFADAAAAGGCYKRKRPTFNIRRPMKGKEQVLCREVRDGETQSPTRETRALPARFRRRGARDGFENTPDILEEDSVAGGVGMDAIRQIQFGISGHTI